MTYLHEAEGRAILATRQLDPQDLELKQLVSTCLELAASTPAGETEQSLWAAFQSGKKETQATSLLRFVTGLTPDDEQNVNRAVQTCELLVEKFRLAAPPEAIRPEEFSNDDFIRGLGLLLAYFKLDEVDPASGIAPPRHGCLALSLVGRIEEFSLDTSSMKECILRTYQEFGSKFLLVANRAFLGDEMGLGKTIQVLAALCHRHRSESPVKALVLVPAGLRNNWESEIRTKTKLDSYVLYGPDFLARLKAWAAGGGVAIISYSGLRLKLTTILAHFGDVDFVVADEAQFIKNPVSKRSKATAELMEKSRGAVAMTGTPIENHPNDFLSILKAIHGKRSLEAMGLSKCDGMSPESFRERVSNLYLRRNKEDVLHELPEQIDIHERVIFGKKNLQDHLQQLRSGVHFMQLRLHAVLGSDSGSPKLQRTLEIVRENYENGRSTVIFTFFRQVMTELQKALPDAEMIHGDIPISQRGKVFRRFSGDKRGILLVQISAGGVGLNLQTASSVILIEPQLNPATEDQAIARVHRMGQRSAVTVHRLTSPETIEDSIVSLLERKRERMRQYARESNLKDQSVLAVSNQEIQAITKSRAADLTNHLASGSLSNPK